MQKSTNLYAPPETPTGKPHTEGIWRYGNLLAVAHSAELPTQWCFKTNEPTTHVGSLFLGAKLFSDRKWFLSFGLNEQLAKRRVWRQRIAIASFLAFTAVLTPVATFAMLHSQFLIPQYLGSGEVFDNALLVFMSLLAIAAFFFRYGQFAWQPTRSKSWKSGDRNTSTS